MQGIEGTLARFRECTIGVVGDSVADIYILGSPARISREAPVMVVRKEEERFIPGCAANTVSNLVALGCRVAPVTLLGDDEAGRTLMGRFESLGVRTEGVLLSRRVRTVTKTRIMVGDANRIKRQVIRVDNEPRGRASAGSEKDVEAALEKIDCDVDAWLVSDYGYDLVSDRIVERLLEIAREKTVVVDSRHRLGLFKGVRCLTPNEGEAQAASGIPIRGESDARDAGWALLKGLKAESLLMTRGNKGMILFEKSGAQTSVPVMGDEEVVDVSGAGDTVAAALTLALVAGASPPSAARLANAAAGVVVMKSGAAACSLAELEERLPLIEW